ETSPMGETKAKEGTTTTTNLSQEHVSVTSPMGQTKAKEGIITITNFSPVRRQEHVSFGNTNNSTANCSPIDEPIDMLISDGEEDANIINRPQLSPIDTAAPIVSLNQSSKPNIFTTPDEISNASRQSHTPNKCFRVPDNAVVIDLD